MADTENFIMKDSIVGYSKYTQLSRQTIIPMITYMKLNSQERFNNILDLVAEEQTFDSFRTNYIIQSVTNAVKLVCFILVNDLEYLHTGFNVHPGLLWLEREM